MQGKYNIVIQKKWEKHLIGIFSNKTQAFIIMNPD